MALRRFNQTQNDGGCYDQMSAKDFNTTLSILAEKARDLQGKWWVIGSAAAKLSGLWEINPDDVDVVGDERTLTELVHVFGREVEQYSENHRFRSKPYQRILVERGLPIEVMGRLQVHVQGHWQTLRIETRCIITEFGPPIWVPEVDEQIAIFRLFGRPKDLQKAERLERLQHSSSS
jgi:hypothetical protein